MRVFSIGSDGEFTEYEQLPFKVDHEESVLEEWLESNPDGILEDGQILIIGRQVRTDLGACIDLLGVDREGNAVVIELKRDRTPRDVVAQALEYAARLDVDALEGILRVYEHDESLSLADRHREHFGVEEYEAVAFNKDQHIVVVGQRVTPEIRRTASFLGSKGIQVTCVEFTFFQAEGGGRLLSHEIVVGREHAKPRRVASEARLVVSEEEFLKSCDENGEIVFSRILDLARRKSMSISWGTKGFSIGVDVDGIRVVVCYGYPPTSVFKQTLYTALRDRAGIQKTGAPAEAVGRLRNSVEATGLFTPAGRDLKCIIDRAFTDDEVDKLVAWCEAVEQAIAQHGLNATPEQ